MLAGSRRPSSGITWRASSEAHPSIATPPANPAESSRWLDPSGAEGPHTGARRATRSVTTHVGRRASLRPRLCRQGGACRGDAGGVLRRLRRAFCTGEQLVGAVGFGPTSSCSQSTCATVAPRPDDFRAREAPVLRRPAGDDRPRAYATGPLPGGAGRGLDDQQASGGCHSGPGPSRRVVRPRGKAYTSASGRLGVSGGQDRTRRDAQEPPTLFRRTSSQG